MSIEPIRSVFIINRGSGNRVVIFHALSNPGRTKTDELR
jgi:hypothetical protein